MLNGNDLHQFTVDKADHDDESPSAAYNAHHHENDESEQRQQLSPAVNEEVMNSSTRSN